MKGITTFTKGTILKLHRFSPEMRAVTIGVPWLHRVSAGELNVSHSLPDGTREKSMAAVRTLNDTILPVFHTFRPGPAFCVRAYTLAGAEATAERYYSASFAGRDIASPYSRMTMHTVETVIDLARDNPNTSARWQQDDIKEGMPIDLALALNLDGPLAPHFEIYQHASEHYDRSVELEDDALWPFMKFLLYGPGTGFVPFLYYIRYMAERKFGRVGDFSGADVVAVMCVKRHDELMFDEELREYEQTYPRNLRIVRIVTREQVPSWPLLRLRRPITRCPDRCPEDKKRHEWRRTSIVNMRALVELVPDLATRSLRVCGSHQAWYDIADGYTQCGYHDQLGAARRETWG